MHLDKLPDAARRVLSDLSCLPAIKDFILIGGTALTLHLGHRQSEDLDFLYPGAKLPGKTIAGILEVLEKTYPIKDAVNLGDRQVFDNGGGDLNDYHQDWSVGGAKVTFYAEAVEDTDARSCLSFGEVHVLGLDGIFRLKSRLLCKRLTSRDLFDLWCFLEKCGKDIGDIIAHVRTADSRYDEDRVKHRLLKDALRQSDPGFSTDMEGAPRKIEELRAKLADFFDLYEERRAEEIRRSLSPLDPEPEGEAPIMKDILIHSLTIPAAKFLLKKFLGEFGFDVADGLAKIAKKKISDYSDQLRAERLFTDYGQQIAERLLPTFEEEAKKSELDVPAVMKKLAAALEEQSPQEVLIDKNDKSFFTKVLEETMHYLTDTASALPKFHEKNASEILKRLSRMGDDIDRILATAQQIERLVMPPDQGEESRKAETGYRHTVIRKLDYMELFGADIPPESRRHSLSVAYVSLNLEDSDDGEDGTKITSATAVLDGLNQTGGRLLIRGDAGTGKSTLLRWAAIRAAGGEDSGDGRIYSDEYFKDRHMEREGPASAGDLSWRMRVPFLVRLRDIKDGGLPSWQSLPDKIADQPWKTSGDWVKEVLNEKRGMILLDGLDEVPNAKRERVKSHLSDYVNEYPGNFFVVTTRPAAVPNRWLSGLEFNEARIAPMSNLDRKQFVGKWHEAVQQTLARQGRFEDLQSIAANLVEKLPEAPSLALLATNPLMCAMICALHRDRNLKLPESESELCEALCHMLLHRREWETPGLDMAMFPLAYRNLGYEHKRAIVREIAGNMLRNEISTIQRRICEDIVGKTLGSLSGCDSKDAKVILDGLIDRSGMLRETIPGVHEYIHNTFKEYLGADWLVNNRDEVSLAKKANQADWRPVLRFAAATRTPDFTNELLGELLKAPQDISGDDLRVRQILALQCASAGLYVNSDLKEKLAAIEKNLFPPHNMTEAEALAVGGDSVVEFLKHKKMEAQEAASCVRALRLIGTGKARKCLEGYLNDNRESVYRELAQAVEPLTIPAVLAMVKAGESLPDDISSQIKDLSPLAALKQLQSLNLGGTQVSDLSPLAALKQLQSLDLYGTQVSDLSPLAALKELRSLNLIGTQVSDLSPLADLKELQLLGLYGTQVSDLSPLAALKQLQSLGLYGTQVSDLSPLFGLKKMKYLDIRQTNLTDLGPLENMPGLEIRR